MNFRFIRTQSRLLRALTMMAFAFASHAKGNQVVVKPVVEIDQAKSDITLSDVIAVKGLSHVSIEKFQSIKIADAPKAGESRVFTQEIIANSIKADLESVEAQTGEHFETKIPSRVTVTKRKLNLGVASLKAQLLKQFKAICSDCEFEISNLNAPAAAKLAPDATWVLRTRNELPKGSFSYPIEITLNDVTTQTLWVAGQLMIHRPVSVATREITIGEHIQSEDLVTQMKDVTFINDAPISLAELSSGVAARQIAVGQIVFRSSLRKELAIRSGDTVKVTTSNDQWEISLDGISQTSGYVGDLIKVKIPKTQKLISGLLREKGVVEVQ